MNLTHAKSLAAPLAIFVLSCASTQHRAAPEREAGAAPSTRYRVGDFVVYRYTGSFSSLSVIVREDVEAQEGNRLTIRVSIRRGDSERQFLQVLTDTSENQKAELVDELYILENGQRRRLANEKNTDLYRLYEWIVPPVAGAPADVKTREAVVSFAGISPRCREETGRYSGQRPLRFRFTTCPEFLWTNGPAEIVVEASGDVSWKREVAEFGHAPAAAEQARIGPLVLSIADSPTAVVFHVVDQLSVWSEFCHQQYGRWAANALNLGDADHKLLDRHAELRRARGWGKGFEQAFYVSLPIDRAASRAVELGLLKPEEASAEREILEHFAPKLRALIEAQASQAANFRARLPKEALKLAPLMEKLARFTDTKEPVKVPVYLIPNPEAGSSGGGFNGGRLVLEVQDRPDPMPTLLHEALHALLAPHKELLQKAATGVEGLNAQMLEEGIAYALMPGMVNETDSGADVLAESLALDVLRSRPATDPYVRFKLVALTIRPLLHAALDRQESLSSFLPKAIERWRSVQGRR